MAWRLTIAQTSNRILWNISHGYEAYGAGKFCPSKKTEQDKMQIDDTIFLARPCNCFQGYFNFLLSELL